MTTRWALLGLGVIACGCGGEASGPPSSPPAEPQASTVAPAVSRVPPSTAPPIDPACEVARARASSVLAPVSAQIAAHARGLGEADPTEPWNEISSALSRCVPAGRGAWIALPTRAELELAGDASLTGDIQQSYRLRALASIAYVGPDAAWLVGSESFHVEDLPLVGERTRLTIDSAFDYDGDGVAEVIATFDDVGYESEHVRHVLLGVTGGRVAVYPPASEIDVDDVVDFDADGRPDLVSIARYWHALPCGDGLSDEGTPAVLFHARADGTFSASDDVAAAYLREACPSEPAVLLEGGDCGGVLARRNLACARSWGLTADRARAQLERERRAMSAEERTELDATTDWDLLLAFAAIDPPVVLSAPDSAPSPTP